MPNPALAERLAVYSRFEDNLMTLQEYMPWTAEVERALRFMRAERAKLSMWGELYTPTVYAESREELEAELQDIYERADSETQLVYACFMSAMMESRRF